MWYHLVVCGVQVRTLEAANAKLELQIREYYEKQGPVVSRDFSKYLATIADLRARVLRTFHTPEMTPENGPFPKSTLFM